MPRSASKLISAVVQATSPKAIKAKSRVIVRRMAHGTLLAVTLAAAHVDVDEVSERKRLFDSGLLDRLKAPLTRYRE
jgi:hypothetical protein